MLYIALHIPSGLILNNHLTLAKHLTLKQLTFFIDLPGQP